ncbi:hypothetical protein AB3R30_16385 [Leptolyngbyaceae cyanobacterium UHCC 1019]
MPLPKRKSPSMLGLQRSAIAATHDIRLLTADKELAERAISLGVGVQLLQMPL